ncbi:MerR family transcriptional regulator [Alteribacillus bidgolensis]|uniref:MerR family transcriptional regulator, glutamine synthetase repressor n=1 Tax=Alteribacillus bidgolensis TaxID=930129 RepID=A0A1G8LU83_9BACI|nr:MerR family transcriptional regulator [Alteribacillus bidgolensis]SDI59281.1 MerR family transcriptional regulator, glutamine synthetase repressor [Alteribacillus bidgolensis]
MKDHIPRRTACFPISVVQELTSLSARQIRYYEQQGLIHPKRNEGNQRLFSLEDIDRCAEIKELIDQGLNIAGVKTVLSARKQLAESEVQSAKSVVNRKDMKKLRMYLNETEG